MRGGFAGEVVIQWPRPRGVVSGFLTEIFIKDRLITTVSNINVHADTESVVWAELTMWADGDGRPLYDGAPCTKDDQIVTGTFMFLVTEMRVAS